MMNKNDPQLGGTRQRIFQPTGSEPVLGGDKQIAIYCHRCRRAYPKDTKTGIWFKEMDKDGNVIDVQWECDACDSRWSGMDYEEWGDDEYFEDDDDFGWDDYESPYEMLYPPG